MHLYLVQLNLCEPCEVREHFILFFSLVVAPICNSTNNTKGFLFSTAPLTLFVCCFLFLHRAIRGNSFSRISLFRQMDNLTLYFTNGVTPLEGFWCDVKILGIFLNFFLSLRFSLPFLCIVVNAQGFGPELAFSLCTLQNFVLGYHSILFSFNLTCALGGISPYFELSYKFKYMFVVTFRI